MKGVAQKALEHYEDREHSLVKHTILASYLQRCLMIIGLWSPKIAYVDCFAGPWKSSTDDLSDTSPGIAIRHMAACQAELHTVHGKTVRVRSIFVEADAERAELLDMHVQRAPTNIVRPEIWRTTFEDAIPGVLRWLEPDEFAFVFVDPFGWKGVVEPAVLAPFLNRPRTELLINFMWNFINLATGLPEQVANLTAVFGGDEWRAAMAHGSEAKQRDLMRLYRRKLAEVCRGQGGQRLRTAMLPVEYIDKKKVIFNLVYATHNATGLVVFWEQAEEAARQQSRLKVQHHLNKVAKLGQGDFFSADDHRDEPSLPSDDLKIAWLRRFPRVGDTLTVDMIMMADLIEETDALISDLQGALGVLVKEGVIVNIGTKRPRRVNVVNYRKKEVLRRLT